MIMKSSQQHSCETPLKGLHVIVKLLGNSGEKLIEKWPKMNWALFLNKWLWIFTKLRGLGISNLIFLSLIKLVESIGYLVVIIIIFLLNTIRLIINSTPIFLIFKANEKNHYQVINYFIYLKFLIILIF